VTKPRFNLCGERSTLTLDWEGHPVLPFESIVTEGVISTFFQHIGTSMKAYFPCRWVVFLCVAVIFM
jgi:hypothetical protein